MPYFPLFNIGIRALPRKFDGQDRSFLYQELSELGRFTGILQL